ncbi:uncharacterized protein LOC108459070 [Gossypium arboreum]|uniref:uncharacterized protein LOC108459070 n=1 Tax=Gossypium arboreum TaxID=29729 RepID=UPI000819567B|nr:uncharacterized protein LOC108459070 [Gossypium arboreum]
MADALSHKAATDLRAMFTKLSLFDDRSLLAKLQVKPTWVNQIRDKQMRDKYLELCFCQVEDGAMTNFEINSDGVLCFHDQICVQNDEDLRLSILREAHSSPYAMHPSGNKMYQDLREFYWWSRVKCEITNFVARCLTCQQTELGEQRVLGDRRVLVSELVAETEDKVCLIREHLKAASDRQKSYTNLKRKDIEYSVGDMRVGPVTYQLELPPELDRIHDMFHVLMLRRYRSNPTQIVPVKEIEVRPDLTFEEDPVQILDCGIKVLRKKSIPLVKVLWRNHSTEEATWEPEDSMCQQYPHLFCGYGFTVCV